ncbi:MAG: hypothetical protein AAF149_14335 [Bacteroidota bacterium]
MNDLLVKYNSLSPDVQKEVDDFLDFMLSKYKGTGTFDMKRWKAKIKNISTWSEEDVKTFEENRQQFNQWKSEKW